MEFDFVLYDMIYVCFLCMYVCMYVCMYLDELRVVAALLFRSSCRTATATATVHPMHVIFMYVICLCMYVCMYVSVVVVRLASIVRPNPSHIYIYIQAVLSKNLSKPSQGGASDLT